MSRCFPFPPPGYVQNQIRDESLIESIKGAKEEVRKDRKHNKDKKRKERENGKDGSKKHRHKRRRGDESANASSKKVDDHCGVEFLDKSCLTVELELQTSSQTSCDSTLHSNETPKRIRSQPLDDEVMMIKKDKKRCSSRERLNAAPKDKPVSRLFSTSAPREASRVFQEDRRDRGFGSSRETTTKLSKEKKTIPLQDVKLRETNKEVHMQLVKEKPSSSHQETTGSSSLFCSKCPPSMAVQFLNLVENWAPDQVESKLTDSEEWLFMKFNAKRHHQVSKQTTCNGSSSMLRPTARFLPEAELYALPFTVPF